MRIKKITIKNLHGEYNYSVNFDEKLTFLFGANGSGKTTLLNIVASIITGKVYNLVEYDFEKITLYYKSNSKKNMQNNKIVINSLAQTTQNYEIVFEEEKCIIEDIYSLKERMHRKAEQESADRVFIEMYPMMKKIRDTFNYVYLPLNRYGINFDDGREMYYRHRGPLYMSNRNPYHSYLNESLRQISEMIRDNCARINVEENRINDKFRQEVLTSSIQVSSEVKIGQIIEDIHKSDWSEILKTKRAYVKILGDIGVLDKVIIEHVDNFFMDFKKDYEAFREDKGREIISVGLAWKYSEFLKIKNISGLAKDNEQKKEEIRKPIQTFLEVITNFFESSGSDKIVKISTEGMIYFVKKSGDMKRLSLSDLSSGEKQIIIIFASLIFGLQGEKTGIYIVDEPEASLHLTWQAEFVSEILKVNKNVQLIFATHSPELIGNYRDKAVKLQRN